MVHGKSLSLVVQMLRLVLLVLKVTLVQQDYKEIPVLRVLQEPLVLQVKASSRELAALVAYFIADWCKGGVSTSPDGIFTEPSTLLDQIGSDFNMNAAIERVLRLTPGDRQRRMDYLVQTQADRE